MDGELRRIAASNGVLACHVSGAGPPLVALHPALLDSRVWSAQRSAFSDALEFVAIDQRGHGESPAPTASYDPVADVHAVVASMGLNAPIVMGLGDAAGVALRVALGGHVRALVLAVPEVGMLIAEAVPEFDMAEALTKAMTAPDMERLVELTQTQNVDRLVDMLGDDPRALSPEHPGRTLLHEMIKHNIENVHRVDLAELATPAYGDAHHQLDVPTLVITTRNQPNWNVVERALRARVRNLNVRRLPTDSNLINLELPTEYNSALAGFVSGVTQSA